MRVIVGAPLRNDHYEANHRSVLHLLERRVCFLPEKVLFNAKYHRRIENQQHQERIKLPDDLADSFKLYQVNLPP